jgi:hypothetical protein
VQFLFNAKDAELKKCPAIHSPEGLHIHRNKNVLWVFPALLRFIRAISF